MEEGAFYHLYNRGHNKELIFFEEMNYDFFLAKFKDHVIPYADVFAYCLMPNHFHFFIRVNQPSNFKIVIKNFFISYSKAINKRYDRVGALFQGTYRIKEIDSDSYYTSIITYIHLNPVEAGLVAKSEQYKYSSFKALITNSHTLVKREEVLNWFGGKGGMITDHHCALSNLSDFENLTSF